MLDKINRKIINKTIEDNLDGLIRFAFFRLGDMSEAEDIVHDGIVRLLDNPPSILKPISIKAYMYKIVYNLCQDYFRTGHRKIPIESIEEPIYEDGETLDTEEADRIFRILAHLPSKESQVIQMNVIDELSFTEISHILSTPATTIKSRFKSGMEKLRKTYSTI